MPTLKEGHIIEYRTVSVVSSPYTSATELRNGLPIRSDMCKIIGFEGGLMIAAKCAHRGQDAVLKTGCEVYPHRRDLYELFFWVCLPCNARVGCHKKGNVCDGVKSDGTLPLGTAAIHNEVDPIWQRQKQRGKARKIVYTVLTNYGRTHGFIGANDTYHTGSLSLQQCAMLNTHWSSMKKVIEERIQLELESI